ncbi:hypothetical protein RhiirC2_711382 [Rhizophagus irregularis]|uniref:G-protein coupled receptors family 1 profile domain-containing protein n=1 Tax=Rhizophagus irregularis TaxID=588596 RepID=A0A2N1NB94_9GLOM|nr:hypothetical protein RhiirC2_711382 [Rhizophagus irregularis]
MEINFIQTQAYVCFWLGASIMICIHNMVVAIISYKTRRTRKTHASSILKIIFNFGQIMRNSGSVGSYITPKFPTILQCTVPLYITYIGNIVSRLSLTAFLLWRIRQIDTESKVWDKRICILLFVIRAAFTIPYLIFQRISTMYISESDTYICYYDFLDIAPYGTGGIVTDFIVDIYVTSRLVLILQNANKNASQLSLNIRSKRTLFTAVTYWNFLRLIISLIFHLNAVLDIFNFVQEGPSMTVKCLIHILLSYVITIDAEIVQAIEGKGQQNGSSTNTDDQTHSQIIDNDKIIVVSMKELTFFECQSKGITRLDGSGRVHAGYGSSNHATPTRPLNKSRDNNPDPFGTLTVIRIKLSLFSH